MKCCFLLPALLFFFPGTLLLSQSGPTYILKVDLNDSVRHYLEHKAMAYCYGDYEISFSVNSTDLDTAYSYNSKNKVPSLAEIKKQRNLLCHCGKDYNVYHEIGCIYDYLNMSDSAEANLSRALELVRAEQKKFPDSLALFSAEAMIQMHRKDYSSSIGKFEEVLKKDPVDSLGNIMLPMLYLGIGDSAGLFRIVRADLQQDPSSWIATFYYVLIQGMRVLQEPDSVKGKKMCNAKVEEVIDMSSVSAVKKKYEKYHPEIMENYLQLFSYFCMKARCVTATTSSFDEKDIFKNVDTTFIGHYYSFFTGLLQQKWFSNNYSCYKALAFTCILLHRPKEAISWFRKAIDAFPPAARGLQYNDDGDYGSLSFCYDMINDSLNAERTLKERIRVRPGLVNDASWQLILARHYTFARNFSEARKCCQTALKINPNSDRAYLMLGCIAIQEKNYKEALAQLDKAFKLNNNEVNTVILAGIASLLNGSPDTAHTLFKQLHDYDNTDTFVNDILQHYFF